MAVGGCSGRNHALNPQGSSCFSDGHNYRDGGSRPERFEARCTKGLLDNCESFYNLQSLRDSDETSKTLKKRKFGSPSTLSRKISRLQEKVLKRWVKGEASVHIPSLDMSWHAAEEFQKQVKKNNETKHEVRNRCLIENNGDIDNIKDNMELIFHEDLKIEQDVLSDYKESSSSSTSIFARKRELTADALLLQLMLYEDDSTDSFIRL